MRNRTHFLRRVTALVLSLIMLLTPTVNAIAATLVPDHDHDHSQLLNEGGNEPVNDGKWHGTTGTLISANYDMTDAEKAILACTGILGETFAVQIPTDEKNPDLVSVDATAQTVTALPYAVDGQVWTPTKAILKYNQQDGTAGVDIEVPLTETEGKYVGVFQKPANSYRVEVTYSLLITVENALQTLLLDTPYYLVDGYDKVYEAYSIFSQALEPFEEMIEDLRALYEGVKYEIKQDDTVLYTYTIGLKENSEVKEAIGYLLEDYDNNGKHFTLAKDCDDYQAALRDKKDLQFMFERGAEMKDHIAFFSEQIKVINENSDELRELAKELRDLAEGPENLDDDVTTIADALVLLEQEYEKLIDQTVEDLFNENWAEIKEAMVEEAFDTLWAEKKQEIADEAYKTIDETITEEVEKAIEDNKDEILDETLIDDAVKQVVEEAVKISNEAFADMSEVEKTRLEQLGVNLSLESLSGKTRQTTPTLLEELDAIKSNYVTAEFLIGMAAYNPTSGINRADADRYLALVATAKQSLFASYAVEGELNLEVEIEKAYKITDEELLEEATTQATLLAWQEAAKELVGKDCSDLTLEEAKATVKTEIEKQLNDTNSDLYKEAEKKIKDEISAQLENPTTPEYEELRDEAIALAKEKIEEEVRKEAEPLLEEKKAEIRELGETALAKAEQIEDLLDGKSTGVDLDQIESQIDRINKRTWHYLGKDLVKDDITDEEFAILDDAVHEGSGIIEQQRSLTCQIKNPLVAYETVLTGLVSQQVVTVELKAEVVSKNSVDSDALVPLDVHSTTFAMDIDSSADSILAQIEASGIENKALSQWDPYYNVGKTFYNRTVSVLDKEGNDLGELGNLTQDIRYIISYSPKTFTVTETYKESGSNVMSVPYGYNFTLPLPTEVGNSYDYKVNGTAQREGTIYRVVENITVERTLGKALDAKGLAELIAMSTVPGTELSEKEKAVLNTGAFLANTIYFRTPDSNDKLTKVTADGAGYKLEAEAMTAGLVQSEAAAAALSSEAKWVPVKAYPVFASGNGAEFALSQEGEKYVGTFTSGEELIKVQVIYQLTIEGIDADLIQSFANLADTLVKETKEQKQALDDLCTKENFYNNLGELTRSILGSVDSVVDLTPKAQAALDLLYKECMGEKNSYLYEYLTQYKSDDGNGGLAYFYNGNNAANIIKQIELINTYLPDIWNDEPVKKFIEEGNDSFKAQAERVDKVIAHLKSIEITPVNELVNTNSGLHAILLAAVADAENETSVHTVSDTITLETVLSAGAPDQTPFGVSIQVLNKNGTVVNTYTDEAFRGQGKPVGPLEFQAMYEALLATVPNAQYYNVSFDLPEQDVILGEDPVILIATLTPVSYTVKIDGEADQTIYAFDAYTITLPGTGEAGFKYIYDIAGNKVEIGTGSVDNFSLGTSIDAIEALFGADRELTITREKIDINRENLLVFVENLNKAIANAGLLSGNNLELAFIPTEDAQGNLSIVLRISKGNTEISTDALMGEVMKLVNDLSYVALNGSTLFGLDANNEMKVYLQTMINFITNSGLGIDTIPEIVLPNGDLVEMTLPGNTVLGAVDNNIVISGGVINDVDQLGAKLIESTMQYGVSVNNCINVPFYVTLQDFDKMSDLFAKARKGAEQILPYVNLTLENGKVNAVVNAPDSAYAYMLTALLVTGEIDFETIQSYDLSAVIDYIVGLIDPAFADESIDADTMINTIKKTGFYDAIDRFDIESHKALINTIYNGADYAYDSVEVTGSSVGGFYEGTVKYNDIATLLSKKPELDSFKTLIAELNTGVTTDFTFHLKNRDAHYEALILDIRADGILGKYTIVKDAASAIAKAGDNAIVVLLSDLRDNITFNNDVILNLNGYSINGNLTAKGNVVIVDSTLSTDECGSVTGTLTKAGGTFRIGSGKFASDVTEFLDTGFVQENGAVTNGFYELVKNQNEIKVYLGSADIAADKASVKVIAADLLTKLIMNFYACSELRVDDNGIYAIDLQNVTESLDNLAVLFAKVVECIDCVGSSTFATQFLNDVTDFAAISASIENGTPIVSYTLTQSGFNPYLSVESENGENFFAFNVAPSDNKKNLKLSLYVSDEVSGAHKDLACDILEELDRITTFNELKVDFTDITYTAESGLKLSAFDFEGSATADVLFDLTGNVNYPVILAAILAKNATGSAREELVNAIKDYQTSNATAALKSSLEKATVAQVISALKATKNTSFSSIMTSLGIYSKEAVELESLYAIARRLLGTAADYADITGPSAMLGGLKVSGEYGTYAYSLKKGASSGKVTLKVFTEEKDIVVKNKDGIIVMNSDDLAEVLENVKEGYTVYINGKVILSEDVILPAVKFAVEKAENINFAGKYLWFDNGNTVLTIDRDISSNVKNDTSIFCSAVDYTMNGELFVFQLHGDAHKWITVPAVKPECGKPGSTEGVACEYCGKFQEGKEPQVIPALEHNYEPVVTPPTCTDEGYTTYTCSNCGDSYVTNKVPAIEHKGYEKVIPAVPATCTTDGWTEGLECTLCGEVLVAPQRIPASHTPEEVEVEPTCTEPGITGKTVCEVCGETIDEGTVIPAKGHTITLVPGVDATCTDTGLTPGVICSVCDHVFVAQEVTSALGHIEVIDPAVEPTCTETGLTEGKHCKRCDAILVPQQVIPEKGHDVEIIPEVPATCTNPGHTAGEKCKVCNVILVEPQHIDQTGHTKEEIPAVKPTCTEPGMTAGEKCSVCGVVLVPPQPVNATGHSPELIPGTPATEDSTGLTDGEKCSVCGEILTKQETLQKLPKIHVPTVNVVTPDGLIRGAKVDADAKLIYLDAGTKGLKASEFGEVFFKIDNATNSSITPAGLNGTEIRTGDDLICNGDTVTVWAENADHVEVSVTYTIIMMGDANCDGRVNARDLSLMDAYVLGLLPLEAEALLAADMNCDSRINARDLSATDYKVLYWENKGYVTQVK